MFEAVQRRPAIRDYVVFDITAAQKIGEVFGAREGAVPYPHSAVVRPNGTSSFD
jgi:hypothetical protein